MFCALWQYEISVVSCDLMGKLHNQYSVAYTVKSLNQTNYIETCHRKKNTENKLLIKIKYMPVIIYFQEKNSLGPG
jgi:hypothetical protein